MNELVKGFSKYTTEAKMEFVSALTTNPDQFKHDLLSHYHPSATFQKKYDEFAENTLSNYFLPFNIAPNFLINKKIYHVPMVIEESSVVAAASSAASFWAKHGGFTTEIMGTEKLGHVHFKWKGAKSEKLSALLNKEKAALLKALTPVTHKMDQRGGGVKNIELISFTQQLPGIYQLKVSFETVDAMGANFINTVLENLGQLWKQCIEQASELSVEEQQCEIIMCILSNHTPDCRVKASVSAPVSVFDNLLDGYSGKEYAAKFKLAVDIACVDPYRATTHNKGIYNGIDAVVLATGNDFRAIEAAGHTYASKGGQYTSLSRCDIDNDLFTFTLEVPLAVGTVGGMTNLHPLAKWALEILGKPSAEELMSVIACTGMANNFSAVRALTTKGIQQGHMRMHLGNILNTLGATTAESTEIKKRLVGKSISHSHVEELLRSIRNG